MVAFRSDDALAWERVARWEAWAARKLTKRVPRADPSDRLQEARLGLFRVFRSYQPGRGSCEATYARYGVQQATRALLRDLHDVSSKDLEKLHVLAEAEQDLLSKLRTTPTLAQVARHAGLDPEDSRNLRARWQDQGDRVPSGEMDPEVASYDPREGVEDKIAGGQCMHLRPQGQERTAMDLRLGGADFDDVGRALGRTSETARQVFLRAVAATRQRVEGKVPA